MEKKEFVYKAFISYTARDTQFVNKLEEWLIHLSKHADADQKYKFFRDRSYSNVGENVEEGLKQKLNESEWLILVCSPFINDYKDTEIIPQAARSFVLTANLHMHIQQIINTFML